MSSPQPVVIWSTAPETVAPEAIAAGRRLLDDSERQRADRFVYEEDRRLFVTAHVLARLALSAAAPEVPPGDWGFVVNAWGRPSLAPPWDATGLHFNLSHTSGLAACAVAPHHELGIDVEDGRRVTGTVAVAERFFAPREVLALRLAPPSQQRLLFLRFWTLKEAYIKARGRGISLGLDRFWFDISADPARIAWDPGLDEEPASWRFVEASPTERHLLALAIRQTPPEPPAPIDLRQVTLRLEDGALRLEPARG